MTELERIAEEGKLKPQEKDEKQFFKTKRLRQQLKELQAETYRSAYLTRWVCFCRTCSPKHPLDVVRTKEQAFKWMRKHQGRFALPHLVEAIGKGERR